MSMRQAAQAQQQQLWAQVAGSEGAQAAAAAAAALLAGRHAPSSGEQVAHLLRLARPGGSGAAVLPAVGLLARWARQQGLQPAHARDAALLHSTAAAAQRLLHSGPAARAAERSEQAPIASGCLLLLAAAAAALAPTVLAPAEGAASQSSLGADPVWGATEAVGSALLGGQLGVPEPATSAEAMSAVGSLLPGLLGQPVAACWLLSALLQWLGGWQPEGPSCVAADALAPAYGMLRSAATQVLGRSPPAAAVSGLLRPAYQAMRAACPGNDQAADTRPAQPPPATAAAAVLALGGLAEGLLRSAGGFPEAAQLAAEAEASLAAAGEAAAEPQPAAAPFGPDAHLPAQASQLSLLRDACSLAAGQLAAAVPRPRTAVASLATCQAQSLLLSALSLGPLRQAAAAGVPIAQANTALQRQVACGLAQQAASMSASLAATYCQLDGGTQQTLLQAVQAAARAAYEQYRQLSLSTPADWLAGMDTAAVRQLLDKLFLCCLALLAAAWQAVAPAPHPPAAAAPSGPDGIGSGGGGSMPGSVGGTGSAPPRAWVAAAVLGTLADLQFCRLAAAQYASLLRAVLAEVAGDADVSAHLVACLPCYAELAATCPACGGQPAWLVDGVAAAKAQFLMAALVPCCSRLPQAALLDRLPPLAFLYLLHPHPATAGAAHNLFCALLSAAPVGSREPLAAYYVRRCLEGAPGAVLWPQFGQGLATVQAELPAGSPVALLCLQQLLDKCGALAARGGPGTPELASLAAQQLLLVEHGLLDGAMAACDRMLRSGSAAQWAATESAGGAVLPAAALLRRELLEAVRQTDDCLRKPVLARWLLARGDGSSSATL